MNLEMEIGDWHPFRLVLGRAFHGLTGGFLLLRNFSVAIYVSPRVCFILVLIFDFYFSKIMHLWTSTQTEQLNVWGTKAEQRARVEQPQTSWRPSSYPHSTPTSSNFIAGCAKTAFPIWFFSGFDVVCVYLLFFLLDMKIENR